MFAELRDKAKNIGGVWVHYKLILPNGYIRNWRNQAERRGYIVVVPAAPGGDLFFEEGARVFPEFITQLLADFEVDTRARQSACRAVHHHARWGA